MNAHHRLIAYLMVALAGCAARETEGRAPPALLGEWVDDYGIRSLITDTLWVQLPSATYRVVRWEAGEQFLVAQNHPENPADGRLYTRMDWVPLPESAPWEWAYCLATWDANSAEGAAAAPIPDRDQLMAGCGGHPFSRMRRIPGDSTNLPGRGDP